MSVSMSNPFDNVDNCWLLVPIKETAINFNQLIINWVIPHQFDYQLLVASFNHPRIETV